MKILSGVHQMDEGEIRIDGKPVRITDPLTSQLMGISIIYQELNVLDNMNIAENIFLGREQRKNRVFADKRRMHSEARRLLDEVGLNLDTWSMVRDLSTAQKQMIEVAKALSFQSKIIIMDEPTSSLTETETETLFGIVRKLRDKGVAIVFISHKLAEIFAISDEVAVLRDGVSAGRMRTADCTENDIVNAMVGRDVENLFAKEPAEIGDVVLEVRGLSTKGFLQDISFDLHAGEILGLCRAGGRRPQRSDAGRVWYRQTGIRRDLRQGQKGPDCVPEGRAALPHGLCPGGPQIPGAGARHERPAEYDAGRPAAGCKRRRLPQRPAGE